MNEQNSEWITDRLPKTHHGVLINFGYSVGFGTWVVRKSNGHYRGQWENMLGGRIQPQLVLGWKESGRLGQCIPAPDWEEIMKQERRTKRRKTT